MNEIKKSTTKRNVFLKVLLLMIATVYLFVFAYVTHRYINANRYWEIDLATTNLSVERGQIFMVRATLKNKMYNSISSDDGYNISYHVIKENGQIHTFDNERTFLEGIAPGAIREVDILVKAPDEYGKYKIEIDIVKEGEYWLSDRGDETGIVYITVQ